jgi:DNA-binding PadR family transcriptional regulator
MVSAMAKSRRLANPLALAVLALLFERPMHPYEMAATLRHRHKEESIRLNYGALYTVVEQVQKRGYIVPRETVREGRYPERTVYAITDDGEAELHDWLRELISTPTKEYLQFEAGLALLPVLPPDEVTSLLNQRLQHLDDEIARLQASVEVAAAHQVADLFLVESDYRRVLLEAERGWVADLIRRVADQSLGGLDTWRAFQAERAAAQTRADHATDPGQTSADSVSPDDNSDD